MVVYIVVSLLYLLSIGFVLLISFKEHGVQKKITESNWLSFGQTEIIRGIITVGIVVSHIAASLKGSGGSTITKLLIRFCLPFGAIGVDFFFFFSGYGNEYSVGKSGNKLRWLIRKCINVLIVFLVCFLFQYIGLLLFGYRTTIGSIAKNIIQMNMPRTAAWYIKVQLAMYIFLAVSETFKTRKRKVYFLFLACSVLSVLLYVLRLGEHWWISNLCFPLGVVAALYRKEVIEYVNTHIKVIAFLCVILFMPIYLTTFMNELFLVKLIGNVVILAILLLAVQLIIMSDTAYRRIGQYSLHVYLIHAGLIGWVISEKGGSVHILMSLAVVIIFSYISKALSDHIWRRCKSLL